MSAKPSMLKFAALAFAAGADAVEGRRIGWGERDRLGAAIEAMGPDFGVARRLVEACGQLLAVADDRTQAPLAGAMALGAVRGLLDDIDVEARAKRLAARDCWGERADIHG